MMADKTIQDVDIDRECNRAVEGERVWVLLTHIKPDRRQEFEHFIHDFIAPISARSEPNVLNRTRFLLPAEPNEDGTYTYVFLMDPVVKDGIYSFEKILSLDYSPEETAVHLKLWNDSLASPQVGYEVIQANW